MEKFSPVVRNPDQSFDSQALAAQGVHELLTAHQDTPKETVLGAVYDRATHLLLVDSRIQLEDEVVKARARLEEPHGEEVDTKYLLEDVTHFEGEWKRAIYTLAEVEGRIEVRSRDDDYRTVSDAARKLVLEVEAEVERSGFKGSARTYATAMIKDAVRTELKPKKPNTH